jgi:hypothetical protein
MALARVDLQQSSWTPTADFVVTPSVTWQAGDWVLVIGGTESATPTLGVPTVTGLTFTQIGLATGGSQTQEYMWSALAAGSGSGVITSLRTDATSFVAATCGISAFVYRDCAGFGTPAVLTSSPLTVVNLTRTQKNSIVLAIFGDGDGDLAVTPTPVTGTQELGATNAGDCDVWIFSWPDQGGAGSTDYGMTNHVVQLQMSALAVEVKAVILTVSYGAAPRTYRPRPYAPGSIR